MPATDDAPDDLTPRGERAFLDGTVLEDDDA
jgi:hypothetical protein